MKRGCKSNEMKINECKPVSISIAVKDFRFYLNSLVLWPLPACEKPKLK